MEGLELKIDSPGPNGAGEICFRGRHVFMGYLGEEDKTRSAIDDDGWLHSGDIGSLDNDGEYILSLFLLFSLALFLLPPSLPLSLSL